MAKKGGLGRGLDQLFVDTGAGSEGDISQLALSEIEPDRNQPRKAFDEKALGELADSIAEHGVLQPIVVRPSPAGGYVIIAGERRWRAAHSAGLREIPAIVKQISEEEATELALIENLQREDLNPIEEAMGYRQLMERCGYTQEKAAARLSKSRSAIANSLRLLNLASPVLEALREEKLTAGHAKAILSLESPEAQQQAAAEIIAGGLNVRQAEALCKKMSAVKKEKKKPTRPPLPCEVELSLAEALGTEVHVQYREGRGSLNVSFYSDEQLRAFANLLGHYKIENQGED